MARNAWTKKRVEEEKSRVRRELLLWKDAKSSELVQHVFDNIHRLEDQNDPQSRLSSFVYAVSILVHHARKAVLSPRQVENLIERAQAILQVQRIRPRLSPLSYLYGEIHQTTSLIFRRDGHLLRSSWEQQLASYIAGSEPLGGKGFASLSFANRALRLGYANVALFHFREALEEPLTEKQIDLVRLGILRCLRLSYRWQEAHDFLASYKPVFKDVLVEWEWERLCLFAAQKGEYRELANAVRKKKPHYQASYLIEAFFWVNAQGKQLNHRLPKINSLLRYKELKLSRMGFWCKAAQAMEECFDTDIPMLIRLSRLGKALASTGRLLNIEQELLFWAASARWLARVHSFQLAALSIKQFESLSLRLSEGRSSDVFNIMSDLRESDWMKRYSTVKL